MDGLNVHTHPKLARKNLGVCNQEETLDSDFSTFDQLVLHASYFQIPRAEGKKRATDLLERFGLAEKARENMEALSGGMKRRLQVARALDLRTPGFWCWTSPPRAWTRMCAACFGKYWSRPGAGAWPSFFPPITWRRPRGFATGWPSSTRARSWTSDSPEQLVRQAHRPGGSGGGSAAGRGLETGPEPGGCVPEAHRKPLGGGGTMRLPDSLWGIWCVWKRYFSAFLKSLVYYLMTTFLEPIFYLLSFGVGVGAWSGDLTTRGVHLTYRSFVFSGIIAQTVLFQGFFEGSYGAFVRMYYQKIFQAIAITPVTLSEVLWGELLWDATKATVAAEVVALIGVCTGDFHPLCLLTLIPGLLCHRLSCSRPWAWRRPVFPGPSTSFPTPNTCWSSPCSSFAGFSTPSKTCPPPPKGGLVFPPHLGQRHRADPGLGTSAPRPRPSPYSDLWLVVWSGGPARPCSSGW